jgi:hypothetical protein
LGPFSPEIAGNLPNHRRKGPYHNRTMATIVADRRCRRRSVEPLIDYAIFSITARESHDGLFLGFSWRKVSARGDWFEFENSP